MRLLKYSKEIAKLQEIEETKGKRKRGIKQQKRDKLATQCERCFKWYHEVSTPDRTDEDGNKITSDVVPLCQVCFKKALRKERQRQNIMNAIGEGSITEVNYNQWKNRRHKDEKHGIHSKPFFEGISYGVRKLKRENTLTDALLKCENYFHTKKFKRECAKYNITEKRIIEMTNLKMRKIMDAEGEEFLENEA